MSGSPAVVHCSATLLPSADANNEVGGAGATTSPTDADVVAAGPSAVHALSAASLYRCLPSFTPGSRYDVLSMSVCSTIFTSDSSGAKTDEMTVSRTFDA